MIHIVPCLKLLFGTACSWIIGSSYDISQINTDHAPQEIVVQLQDFEKSFTYPFSDAEQFRIEHGSNGDYFYFFNQLGTPYYYVARCKKDEVFTKIINGNDVTVVHEMGKIAAAGCAVLRTFRIEDEEEFQAWYLCDLKVNEMYQGEHIPLQMAQAYGLQRFFQCSRGYAICMNPPAGEPKAASIAKKHGPISNIETQVLNLYSLTFNQINEHYKEIQNALIQHGYLEQDQPLVFTSTNGFKDYLIFTTSDNSSRSWNLKHLQKTKVTSQPESSEPFDTSSTYMMCSVDGTALDDDFKSIVGMPSSTAQILSYGMEEIDFNFLTSNQI